MAAKSGGCFPGSATVTLEDGRRRPVKDLRAGDRVLAADDEGRPVYSDFIMFLDRDPSAKMLFYVIETESGQEITLTAAHLLFVGDGDGNGTSQGGGGGGMSAVFASQVRRGQTVFVHADDADDAGARLQPVAVRRIYTREHEGSYAPMTAHGTVVVDRVLASCYAVIEDHRLAHWALAPARLAHWLSSAVLGSGGGAPHEEEQEGVHWYSRLLYRLGTWLLDRHAMHPLGMALSPS